MARTPFRSRSGLSGPQPTHPALGKAPGSKWGTKRAKAGGGGRGSFRVVMKKEGRGERREWGGSCDDEDAEAASSKGQRASCSRASETRAFAAHARTTSARRRSPRPAASDSEDEEDEIDWSLGDKRLGRKRREVGSADPDASLSEDDDSDLEVKVVPPPPPQQKQPPPRTDNPDAVELRRLRAEAALARLEKSKVIEVLDSTEEEEVKQQELERLAAGPDSLGSRREKGKSVSPEGKKGGKKGMKKGKGRRLMDSDGEGEDVEQFRQRMKREAEAKKRREKAEKVEENGRLFRDGSADEEEDLKPLDFAAKAADDGSDKNLQPLDRPARAASSSASTSTRRRTYRRRTSPPSSASDSDADTQRYDARALRRARTSGKAASEFINDSDDERDAAVRGGGRWIETGGSGGRIRIGAAGGGPVGTKSKRKMPGQEKKKVGKPAREDSSADEDDAPAPSSDYAHLNLPRFIDPRADLARRKKRELSSPPTSAFESSDGEGPRVISGREQDDLDKFERLDRRMKRKKAKYREERKPGYSNPRRN